MLQQPAHPRHPAPQLRAQVRHRQVSALPQPLLTRIHRRRQKTDVKIDVPIVPLLDEVLRRHRAVSGPVCRGLPEDDGHLHTMLRRFYKKAGVRSAGFHGLRHAWASIMHAAGVPLASIGKLLSHRPGSATTLRYLHVDEAQLVEAMAAVQRALAAKAT